MKKNYLIALFALVCNFAIAQIEPTSYKGAFAPAPTAMWTDSWTNFDPQNTAYPTATVTVSANITENTRWTAGNTYLLGGIIYVKNGATLTIEPGVVVRAGGNNGASLVVTKGAKVEANGTAANPIVFTSSNAAGSRNKGDWGGIIILGKGAFNINSGINNIEGIFATEDTQFGGGLSPDNTDNSGTLRYVRIEFGGYVYAANAEINGLTMGAVGSGTTIDYVQTSFINDDAFEWFGGAVNCKHLVSYRNLDDDFDTDNGYSGNVQYALAIRDPKISDAPAISTSEGFESDNNPKGDNVGPFTSATFSNCTLIGPSYRKTQADGGPIASGFKKTARIRRASQLKIYNSLFLDFEEGLHIDGVKAEDNAVAGTLIFSNNIQAGILTKSIQVTSPGTITAGNNSSFNMTTWYANNGNTTLALSTGLLTRAYGTTGTDYSNLDYRPASAAPVAVNAVVNYCTGNTAAALAATLNNTDSSLRWYTAATGGTALATAIVPSTTAAGSTTYYVSELYATSVESARTAIVVNVISAATPGSISGTASQESIIGTTTAATYSVAAVTGAASYVWTVPTGVTIVSGQGTNTLVVNFKDYIGGRGTIGTLSVIAVNAAGCTSAAAATLELTNAPLQAPTIVTPVNLCVKAVASALTATLTNGAVSLKWYSAVGTALTSAPVPVTAKASTVPYKVSQIYANGEEGPKATIVVNVNTPLAMKAGKIAGIAVQGPLVGTETSATYSVADVVGADSYLWTVPAGVNIVSGQGTTAITVNFKDVAPTAGSIGSIGVTAVNAAGCGSGTSTLAITKALVKAPGSIIMTDGSTTTAIKSFAKYMGTTTVVTLTAAAVVGAASYEWVLPAGVNKISGGTTRIITVDFAGVTKTNTLTATSTNTLIIGVKALNGVGASSPKLFTLTALAPTAAKFTGTVSVCKDGTGSYAITASPLASSYVITAPTGSVVTSANNLSNTTNVLTTNDLTFSVKYDGLVSVKKAEKTIDVVAKNGIASSAIISLKVVATGDCTAATPAPTRIASTEAVATVSATEVYPNPVSNDFNIDVTAATASILEIAIYSLDGTMIVNPKTVKLQEGANTINENVSSLNKGIYIVRLVNSSTGEVITKKLVKN